jgi:hypothetical protein
MRESSQNYAPIKMQLLEVGGLTHGSVSLDDTPTHTTKQTGGGRVNTKGGCGRLDFRGGEQEDSAFSRGFNPCLWWSNQVKSVRG